MAVSDDQPISAENLAAALQESVGEELLFAGQMSDSNGTFWVLPPLSRFTEFVAHVTSNGWGLAEAHVPATVGSSVIVQTPDRKKVEFDVDTRETGEVRLNFSLDDYCTIFRVVGIRSGGGRLLADLLASVGEAA